MIVYNLFLVILLVGLFVDGATGNDTILIALSGYYKLFGPPFQLFKLGSGFVIAQDKINRNNTILPNHTIKYVLSDDGCTRKKALGEFVTLVKDEGVIAVIGLACSSSARIAGYLASEWNVPIIAYGGVDSQLSDKEVLYLSTNKFS